MNGPYLIHEWSAPLPVLASNKVTAKGIHKGLWPDCITGQTDGMFMTIDWVSSDFKVTVNTG